MEPWWQMTETGRIERQSSSYRQGLVLGLTMAEIMLLLVFCLLIAAGAVLRRERAERLDERAARITAQAQVAALSGSSPINQAVADLAAKLPEIAEALAAGGTEAKSKISEFWTMLVAEHEFVRTLENQGLSVSEIKKNVTFVSAVMELKRKGLDLDTMKQNAEIVDALKQVQKANALPDDPRASLAKIENVLKAAAAAQAPALQPAPGKDPSGHKWPPMISLSEADGYYFEKGSAQLYEEFEDRLKKVVVPRLLEMAKEYQVNVIEVVGHTDEQPIGARLSNLDRDLSWSPAGQSFSSYAAARGQRWPRHGPIGRGGEATQGGPAPQRNADTPIVRSAAHSHGSVAYQRDRRSR